MVYPEFQVPQLFDYFATFLWAVSGAIVGLHKRYDFAGVLVIALVAATGGSLLRDGIFLHRRPPVLSDGYYIPLIIAATAFVSLYRRRITQMSLIDRVIEVIDALGVPAFAVIGMQLSIRAGIPAPGVVLIGVINGFGGGLLRDLLVGSPPYALRPGTLNVSAAIFVCILFVVLVKVLGIERNLSGWTVIALFFAVRMLSIRYDWRTKPILPDLPPL
jgi:uncharacterized membrane protein YeiH